MQFNRQIARTAEGEIVYRLGGENPGVLAAAAVLHGDHRGVGRRGNAGQSSRHHDPAIARGGDIDAQNHPAGHEGALRPDRDAGQVEQFLANKVVRLVLQLGQQARTFGRFEPAPEHRLHAFRGESRLDDQKIQILAHIPIRCRLPAPPGGDRWQRQALTEQAAAEAGEKGNEGRGFQQSAAQSIGHRDVSAADSLNQAGHSKVGVGPQLQRIAEAIIHASQDHVHRPETLRET